MRPPPLAPYAAAPTVPAPARRLRGLPDNPPARRPLHFRADTEAEQLLRRTAACLLGEVESLARELVAMIAQREPAYRPEGGAEELHLEVRTSLESSVRTLMDPAGTWEEARRCSWRIGAGRAQLELPLDALLHAFRLGGGLVWRRLVETATQREPDRAHLLLHSAADIWNFVDEHSGLIAEAYRAVESQTAREHRERARLMVQSLLDGTTRLADLATVADALDLPERGRYVVAALAAPDGPRPRPRPAEATADGPPDGLRIVRHRDAEREYALVLLPEGTEPASVAAQLTRRVPYRVGIGPVVGELADIGTARRAADVALRTCTGDGDVALLHERLPAALVVSVPDFGAALVTRALGAVLELDHQDRESMLTTLEVWLDSAGSAQRAGARLYCHRNTVLNRLRRYEQLSGRSLNHPRDLVELTLALDAHRLLPA